MFLDAIKVKIHNYMLAQAQIAAYLVHDACRRVAFLLCCVPLLASPLMCAWSANFAHLAAGRLVTVCRGNC